MVETLTWLIVLESIGLVGLPYAFVLFRRLPDRGWSLAKPLGVLLVSYIWWLLGLTQVIPNTPFTIIAVLVLLGGGAVWLARRHWGALTDFVRREFWTIVLMEMLVLAFFLGWALIRAHVPAIQHTEQPMDFAFLNATLQSPSFPPNDPWLSGHPVSYYYFGYLMMGGLTSVSGVGTAIGYNLALATIPALAAVAAFGLVYNLVRLSRGSADAGAAAGLASVILLLVVGNLEGILEFLNASGIGAAAFWSWVSVEGLQNPTGASATWHPDQVWWWWRASRVIPGAINEFPMFSFILGDLHPHVMSLPFIFLATGGVLNAFLTPGSLGLRWLRRHGREMGVLALLIGALPFINMWDLPTMALVLSGALVVKAYGDSGGDFPKAVRRAATVAGPVLALALVLYFPFYLTFTSQASGALPVREEVTRPVHLLLFWGLLALFSLSFLAVQGARLRSNNRWRRPVAIAMALAGSPILAWLITEIGARLLILDLEPGEPIWRRVFQVLPLAVIIAVAASSALVRSARPDGRGAAFALALLAVAYFLIMGTELFYVVDLFGNRMNTVFKLYYQAWAFLAVACGYGLYYLHSRWHLGGLLHRGAALGWWSVAAVLVLGALYYSAAAIDSRTAEEADRGLTLNGLVHVASSQPGEYDAIRWLESNAPQEAVILEAVGNDYSEFSRVSASTGLPTVIGWIGHELQWRGSSRPFDGRPEDVKDLYQTQDIERARALLGKYGVSFVMVGPRERQQYGTEGLAKFDSLGEPVVSSQGVTLYMVRE